MTYNVIVLLSREKVRNPANDGSPSRRLDASTAPDAMLPRIKNCATKEVGSHSIISLDSTPPV